MKKKIIFGIESYQDQGFYINKVYLGYKDYWETDKDVYGAMIFMTPNFRWDDDEKLRSEIPLEEIKIPGGSVVDSIDLRYEIISGNGPINTEEVKEIFKRSGFEYCPEFEESVIIKEHLIEYYVRVEEIAENWLEKDRKPIRNPKEIWKSMTAKEKENFGEKPDFEVYYYKKHLHLMVKR